MVAKKGSMVNLDNIGPVVNGAIKPKEAAKTGGRPRLNPHDADKKITVMIPGNVHRQLRLASADMGKPMVEIVVDALISHLKKYEGR